jgi:hypothetical protein
MKVQSLKRKHVQVYQARKPLNRLKAVALSRSDSAKARVQGIGSAGQFGFVPANVKVHVLRWPDL